MRKQWPKRELAGLTARQLHDATRLIPVWYEVELADVLAFSPPLADVKALRSSGGLDTLIRELQQVVSPSAPSRDFGTIETARDLLDRGDEEMALRLAILALDRRLFQLVEGAKRSGALSPEIHIAPSFHAPAQALEELIRIDRLQVPAGVDVGWLTKMIEHEATVSFALTLPPEPEDVARLVGGIQGLLRANPIPQ